MPTGYTADIEKGITFREYALRCARAFGACVTMRDDDTDTPIPDEFKVGDYHGNALQKAHARQKELLSMTLDQASILAEKDYQEVEKHRKERLAEKVALRSKYEAMLVEVRKWEPPSPEHREFKEFMESQIVQSIEFDCRTDYYSQPTKRLTSEAWLADRLAQANKDVAYHVTELAAEQERCAGRNRWVRQLRDSL